MSAVGKLAQNRYGELVGQRFGKLTLVKILPRRINRRIAGRFRCECGGVRDFPISRVSHGGYSHFRHCGCETDRGKHRTHGMRSSPEYSSWVQMKLRCSDPSNKDYPRWGGRGVRVHPEWIDSFESFYAHIGPRPPGTSLDRIDNTGDYAPGNVRWATHRQQCENRRDSWTVEINGIQHPSVEAAARAHSVTATTIVRWCEGAYDARRGTKRPPRPGCRRWRTYE